MFATEHTSFLLLHLSHVYHYTSPLHIASPLKCILFHKNNKVL